jgi:hypothetical protein
VCACVRERVVWWTSGEARYRLLPRASRGRMTRGARRGRWQWVEGPGSVRWARAPVRGGAGGLVDLAAGREVSRAAAAG